jgi:Zn-dependent protease
MRHDPVHTNGGRGHTILMIALCLLPLLLLMLVLTRGFAIPGWVVILFLILCFAAVFFVMGHSGAYQEPTRAPEVAHEASTGNGDVPEEIVLKVIDVIYPLITSRNGDQLIIEGRLLLRPDEAYDVLQRRFAGSSLVPLLQESDGGRPVLLLVPSGALPAPSKEGRRSWVNFGLLILTFGTMTWAGAAHRGVNVLENPSAIGAGLPYAFALLLILGAHELGHYFTARRYGMSVSLPYFIPVPFALGTFGAFIRMRSLSPTRRAMFDVAIAGPLAGLLIAVPALIIGLRYSAIVPETAAPPLFMGGADVGSSVLFAFLAKTVMGDAVLEGHRLVLHPVAFAGWLGLFVTALNLFPVGQLDGGHLVHALLGRKAARTVGLASLVALVLLGLFVWSGLLFWAVLIFFLAGIEDAPPMNAVSRLDRARLAMGAAAFVLLLLILVPIPHALYTTFGIHCPYA